MSDTPKRPWGQMKILAKKLSDHFLPYCERIEVAGSLRRLSPMVGDIELIAIGKSCHNLLGESIGETELDTVLNQMLSTGKIRHKEPKRWGTKYKAFSFTGTAGGDYAVDLFLPTPETWAIVYLLRTGSAAFSKAMVTARSQGGWKPDDLHVRDGRVWRNGVALETPSEREIFDLWDMPWIEPADREIEIVRETV